MSRNVSTPEAELHWTTVDEYIGKIADKISDLSLKEGNTDTVKRLKKLIRENETATENLVKVIETS